MLTVINQHDLVFGVVPFRLSIWSSALLQFMPSLNFYSIDLGQLKIQIIGCMNMIDELDFAENKYL